MTLRNTACEEVTGNSEINKVIGKYSEQIGFRKNQEIYTPESPTNGFYFVDKGMVGTFGYHHKKKVPTQIFEPGRFFGISDLLPTVEPRTDGAVALKDSSLLHIDNRSFEILMNNGSFREIVLEELARTVNYQVGRITDLSEVSDSSRKMDLFLERHYDLFLGKDGFELPFTNRVLSSLTGIRSAESVARLINKRARNGLAYRHGNGRVILKYTSQTEY